MSADASFGDHEAAVGERNGDDDGAENFCGARRELLEVLPTGDGGDGRESVDGDKEAGFLLGEEPDDGAEEGEES